MSETTGIHAAMIGILADLPAITKEQWNKGQKYNFRGIDQFLNTLHPLFAKHHVFVTPLVEHVERSEKIGTRRNSSKGTDEEYITFYSVATVRFRFHAEDGSSVDCVTVGEGMDNGDKATNKALSAAFKYALMQTFAVPTEDMIDGDAESPEVTNPKAKRATKSSGKFDRKVNFYELIDYLDVEGIAASDAEDFCVAKDMLADGEHLAHLSDKHLAQIVSHIDRFIEQVREFAASTTPSEAE